MKLISMFCILATLSLSAAPLPFETIREIECEIKPFTRKRPVTPPHIRVREGLSTNWSGYAALTSLTNPLRNSVTRVAGTWTIPRLTSTPNTTYSSIWVGIDGYSSSTVEQIGTEQDWQNGRQQNYAWFEMYPNFAYEILGFPVNVGDSITGVVSYVGNNIFQLVLTNNTRRVTYTVPSTYTRTIANRSSAEWIVEAPSENTVLPLANFGTATMTSCSCTINGVSGPINSTKWKNDKITMITPSGLTKALPSALSTNGQSFSVTWKHQ